MNIRQLESFITISEAGSFSSAAQKLFTSQPALVQQINTMENSLGFTLFERSYKGVALTEKGTVFLDSAKSILRIYKDALTRCKLMDKKTIRIGAEYESMLVIVVQLAAEMARSYSEIEMLYYECSICDILPSLADNKFDICFATNSEKLRGMPHIGFVPLFCTHACCLVPPGHPLSHKTCIEIADLRGENVVVAPPGIDDSNDELRRHIETYEPKIHLLKFPDTAFVLSLDPHLQAIHIYPHWRYIHFARTQKVSIPLKWHGSTEDGLAYIQPPSSQVKAFIETAQRAFSPGGSMARFDSPPQYSECEVPLKQLV